MNLLFPTNFILFLYFVTIFTAELHTNAKWKLQEDYLFETFTPFRNDIKKWTQTKLADQILPPVYPRAEYVTCDVCKVMFPLILDNLAAGASVEEIIESVIGLCVKLEIEAPEVCDGIIRSYGNPLFYIIMNRPDLTGDDFCGILNPGCTPVAQNLTDWEITIDSSKPPIQTLPSLPDGLQTSKILHLTDIHLDVDYIAGSNADCGKPICCRDGFPEFENATAGNFGDTRCALPPSGYDALLEHAATAHGEIKYIFLTGDYVHNGFWFYSQLENGKNIRYVTEKLTEIFPNTPIYPLTGNHEPDVVNMYPPPELWSQGFDISWLYKEVAQPFTKWLGPDQLSTFYKGGYYTIKPEESLRLVVINTNLCYTSNFWLPFQTIDPAGQLQWLADTMLQAEEDGDNVYILGHIPVGSSDCWPVWSQHFDSIVNRFENIIRGQFYGHEHTESFSIHFERGTERPLDTSTLYLGPSGLPFAESSAYKLYIVDGERQLDSTFEIIDHETWILNTTASNELNVAVFSKVFSAKEEYGLKSLRGNELYDFVLRMLSDEPLFMKFQKNYVKGHSNLPCDPEGEDYMTCKMGLLCNCVRAYSGDYSHCQRLEAILNGTNSHSVV